MPEMTYMETLVTTHCWCGIALAIPSNLHRIANDEGKKVYCPLGHTFVYGNSYREQLAEAERTIAEEKRRAKATKDLLLHEERSHAATKGHLTKAKNQVQRVEHGVCPHCNRTFQNLARHMQSKHEEVKS